MNDFKIIQQYFPLLSKKQLDQFAQLKELYLFWNSQINVISRKDTEELYLKHVLHSLGIAKVIDFVDGSHILDVGTGGGFPGIPLAIMYPKSNFFLVDSIGKKIKVVQEISQSIALQNLSAKQTRAEEVAQKFDFVVSRAVTRIKPFYEWVKDKFLKENNNALANGILYLKGTNLDEEFQELGKAYQSFPLNQYFKEDFFDTKQVLYVKRY
jgi:16S rRNA (guanine527-N7)-methyltransferase